MLSNNFKAVLNQMNTDSSFAISPQDYGDKLQNQDVLLLVSWYIISVSNFMAVSINYESDEDLVVVEGNDGITGHISLTKEQKGSNEIFVADIKDAGVKVYSSISILSKGIISADLKDMIEVAHFIEYRLDSVLILPQDFRKKRIEDYQLKYRINNNQLTSLVQNYPLISN